MVYWKMKFALVRWNLMKWLTWQLEELGLLSSDLGEHIWTLAAKNSQLVTSLDESADSWLSVLLRIHEQKLDIPSSKCLECPLFSFVRDFCTNFITRKKPFNKTRLYLLNFVSKPFGRNDEFCIIKSHKFLIFHLRRIFQNTLEILEVSTFVSKKWIFWHTIWITGFVWG